MRRLSLHTQKSTPGHWNGQLFAKYREALLFENCLDNALHNKMDKREHQENTTDDIKISAKTYYFSTTHCSL
jgi:hypothetical protein